MIGVSQYVERLDVLPPKVFTVVAATSTDVLVDRSDTGDNVRMRNIQNLTGADLYFCVGDNCDFATGNYHGMIADKQQYTEPSRRRVSVWSAAGGKVATTEYLKNGL